jgi:hypothetical protein
LLAVASRDLPVCGYDLKGLKVTDERWCGETAPMNVGGNCATDRQPIGASLLLPNSPRLANSPRTCQVSANDIRPLDTGFDLEQTSFTIEAEDPIQATHVQQRASA